ncbi:MAG: glycosyltransferase family 4 protein [candidate division Zixibacteria bacterium]|nr:glycosyltransferase family 4 protein [candidate division Zixibacteria bacterium]
MKKENLLVVTHNWIRHLEDYAGQFLYTIYHEMEDKYNIFVVCPHAEGLKLKEKFGNITVYRYKYWSTSGEDIAYIGNLDQAVRKSPGTFIKSISMILAAAWCSIKVIRKHDIDFLHSHWWIPGGISGYIASVLTGKRLILTSHGADILLLKEFKFLRFFARIIHNRAKYISTVSTFLRRSLIDAIGIDERKVLIFPMPFDVEKFIPKGDVQREPGSVLIIARMIPRKGHQYLILACKELIEQGYDIKLNIIGYGPEKENIQNMINELKLNEYIKILDPVDHKENVKYYHKASMFVLPSITEGFGVVYAESLACGIPTIATNDGGAVDIVQDGITGLTVPSRDHLKLAEAMKFMLDNPEIAMQYAAAGQEFVKNTFTPQHIAKKMLDLYEGNY